MPLAPTRHLVVTGFHRYVRNPIYLGSLMIFVGEALLLGSRTLLVCTVLGWAGAAAFVHWYEEAGAHSSVRRRVTRLTGGRCSPGDHDCIRGRQMRTTDDRLRW